MNKMRFDSVDITAANIEKIGALFPSVITEALDEEKSTPEKKVYKKAINFDLLRQFLSEDVIEGDECYEFTWVGKRASIVEANRPIRKTLRPCIKESKNWETTENLYIEGDNLDVLKLLQESYLGKVKMIYIDPPYNTGNDFVYRDDFKMRQEEYDEESGVYDEAYNRLFRNTESNGRFHSDWCSMMYSRLQLARNLLSDDGVIFVSISEEEVQTLKTMCNEVFGESNFRNAIFTRRYDKNINRQFMEQGLISMNTGLEYILMYSKVDSVKYNPVFRAASDTRANNGYWKGFWNDADRPTMRYDILGVTPDSGQWKWKKELAIEAVKNYQEYCNEYAQSITLEEYWVKTGSNKKFIRRNPRGKGKNQGVEHWVPPAAGILRNTNWSDLLASKPSGVDVPFDSPKNIEVMIELIKISNANNDGIILDFFSGSATTAHAVMQLNSEDNGNRKFIMVQLPEPCDEKSEAYKAGYTNICEIGKERIRRAGEKIKEEAGLMAQNLDIGFRVFKLDSTNMKDVYYSAGKYEQGQLDMFTSNIKEERTDMDLLYGCLLEWGLPLSLPHKMEQIGNEAVHTVNEGDLIACFADKIDESIIREIAKRQPLRAVFRDSSFANSPDKINVGEIFKLLSPNTRVKVL